MKKSKAIGEIIDLAEANFASVIGVKHFKENSMESRGKLVGLVNFIVELVDVIIPASSSLGGKQASVTEPALH